MFSSWIFFVSSLLVFFSSNIWRLTSEHKNLPLLTSSFQSIYMWDFWGTRENRNLIRCSKGCLTFREKCLEFLPVCLRLIMRSFRFCFFHLLLLLGQIDVTQGPTQDLRFHNKKVILTQNTKHACMHFSTAQNAICTDSLSLMLACALHNSHVRLSSVSGKTNFFDIYFLCSHNFFFSRELASVCVLKFERRHRLAALSRFWKIFVFNQIIIALNFCAKRV